MKVVILAGGPSTRLGIPVPKALATIDGKKTILDYQIEKLSKFVPLEDILVVVGYKGELIKEKHQELTCVCNEEYATTNTGKGLLWALRLVENKNVLWLNGDVIFDEKLVGKVVARGSKERKSCVLVDNKKCRDEEVRYSTCELGYINAISKQVKQPEGEALGINFVIKEDLPLLTRHLEQIKDNDYFEKAMENMIQQDEAKFLPINTEGLFCHEIDFVEDLEEVRRYLSTKGGK